MKTIKRGSRKSSRSKNSFHHATCSPLQKDLFLFRCLWWSCRQDSWMSITLWLFWVYSRIIKIKEDLSEIMQDFKFDCEEWARPSHQPTTVLTGDQPRMGFTLWLWGNLCSTVCFWFYVNVCKYTKACNSPCFRAFVFQNKKYCRNALMFSLIHIQY